MALSFTKSLQISPRRNENGRISVLLTGGTGNIGSYYAAHHNDSIALRFLVRKLNDEARNLEPYGQLVMGSLDDEDSLKAACEGIDTVIHLAGQASPQATWKHLLDANIIGTYNMMVAAKAMGCRRLIYASSIHAVSGYPADVQVKTTDPVNPGDLYGVSKCFSEALGRYMAEQEGLSVICLRIGGFEPDEFAQSKDGLTMLDAWISEADMASMIDLAVLNEDLRFGIFHSLSNNRFKRMDISDARELLGYRPGDDMTEMNPATRPLHLREKVMSHSREDYPEPDKSGLREDL